MDSVFLWLLFIIGGFLLGNVLFAVVVPAVFLHKDVRALSKDHNPGAGNVFTHCGVGWGILCLVLDIAKGFIPVYIASRVMDTSHFFFSLTIAAPVLGHAIGIFHHGGGGKCIATAFGVTFGVLRLTPAIWLLPAIYIFFSVFVRLHPHRIRSMVTFIVFGVASVLILSLSGLYSIGIGYMLVAAIAAIKHTRLFAKDEPSPEVIEEQPAEEKKETA